MQMAGFRSLTLGAVIVLALGCNVAIAQDTQKKTPVVPYNAQGETKGAAPVFLNKPVQSGGGVMKGVLPRQNAYGMKNKEVASSPKNVEKARVAFEEQRAKQEALNQQIRESRVQAAMSNFDADRAKNTAADDARVMAKRQAAGLPLQSNDPNAAPVRSGPVEKNFDPYAGSKVIFANPKKDQNGKKPTRLFNTQ